MTRIPQKDRDIIEQAIYLPMVLTILHRDLALFQSCGFKLPKPYMDWVEQTIIRIQKELFDVKQFLRKENIKVNEMKRDEAFTMYIFLYKGYEEYHNYFNPRIRNKVEELLRFYLHGH
ncbi:MAG: hypothetical protein ACI4XL_08155 [Bacillus sp. (in: firmicutes)]